VTATRRDVAIVAVDSSPVVIVTVLPLRAAPLKALRCAAG